MQKELQKQMTVMVAVPVAKEGKRMEGMPNGSFLTLKSVKVQIYLQPAFLCFDYSTQDFS